MSARGRLGGTAFAWPTAIDEDTLAHVAAPLRAETAWATWAGACPVVPRIAERVAPTRLELALEREVHHLQTVCREPRALLRRVEERRPVALARRTSPRALADLLARPRDWEHRTLRGVRPSRVLAVETEDDVELYENVVAARLVDRLLDVLARRREELERIARVLRDKKNFSDETRGSFWRARRVTALWAQHYTDDTSARHVRATLERVVGLERAIQALRDSALYRGVGRGRRVEAALRPTNILVNDPHYRKVGALWRLAVEAAAPSLDAEEVRARRNRAAEDLDVFGLLLVVRALAGFGFTADRVPAPGGPAVTLTGPRGQASLARGGDGELTLGVGGAALRVRTVPVVPAGTDLEALWRALTLESAGPDERLALLLGTPQDLDVKSEALARAFHGWSSPRALWVSPWSLDSVERVARVLGAWDAGARLSAYPAQAVVRNTAVDLPSWARATPTGLATWRPATRQERAAFAQRCEARRAELDRARRPGRSADDGARRALDALEAFADRACELDWLAACPVCEGREVHFEDSWVEARRPEQQVVWVRCRGCEAAWGLRRCVRCEARRAVLEWRRTPAPPRDPAELDQACGRDIWSPPWCACEA